MKNRTRKAKRPRYGLTQIHILLVVVSMSFTIIQQAESVGTRILTASSHPVTYAEIESLRITQQW
jgi:hypothetical protein